MRCCCGWAFLPAANVVARSSDETMLGADVEEGCCHLQPAACDRVRVAGAPRRCGVGGLPLLTLVAPVAAEIDPSHVTTASHGAAHIGVAEAA